MVAELGMSGLGPISLSFGEVDWFGVYRESGGYPSEEIAGKVDKEIMKILDAEYAQAKDVLGKNKATLNRVAEALLEKETLEEEDFKKLIEGK